MQSFNRIIAFAGPYISVVSAGLAATLVAKANVLGIKGLDEHNLATQLSGALTFAIVVAVTWLGHSKWLTGHHIDMQNAAALSAAAFSAPAAASHDHAAAAAASDDDDELAATIVDEALPSDDEEAAALPGALIADGTPDAERAVMPSEVPFAGEPDEEYTRP